MFAFNKQMVIDNADIVSFLRSEPAEGNANTVEVQSKGQSVELQINEDFEEACLLMEAPYQPPHQSPPHPPPPPPPPPPAPLRLRSTRAFHTHAEAAAPTRQRPLARAAAGRLTGATSASASASLCRPAASRRRRARWASPAHTCPTARLGARARTGRRCRWRCSTSCSSRLSRGTSRSRTASRRRRLILMKDRSHLILLNPGHAAARARPAPAGLGPLPLRREDAALQEGRDLHHPPLAPAPARATPRTRAAPPHSRPRPAPPRASSHRSAPAAGGTPATRSAPPAALRPALAGRAALGESVAQRI